MSGVVRIYTDAVYENLKPLYANWEPGKPLQLGDFGTMRDNTFITLGNIADLGLKFSERVDTTKDHKYFASEDSTEVKFHAKGSIPVSGVVNATASLEVNFASKNAVFFNAADCEYFMVANKVELGKAVMALYERKSWKREWAVVTDLIQAGASTIAISGSNSSSIVFEATGNVERINLADASLGITVKSSSNIGYQVVAEKGLIPLLGLCKIQSRFLWWNDDFKPLTRELKDRRLLEVLENTDRVQTDESDEALYFGQIK